MTRRGRDLGFTLIELVVVLLLVGLAASVVAPALADRARDDAAAAARTLEAVYSAARADAVERGMVVRVTIDPSTGAYDVAPASAALDGPFGRGVAPLGSGIRLTSGDGGPVVTTFDAIGRAHSTTRIEVTDDAATYQISVDPWTASLHVRRR